MHATHTSLMDPCVAGVASSSEKLWHVEKNFSVMVVFQEQLLRAPQSSEMKLMRMDFS